MWLPSLVCPTLSVFRKRIVVVSASFALLVASLGSAFGATTYYVDNSCPYNGNGLSQNCASLAGGNGPFNSIANAQSAVTGDQHGNALLLKRGDTFREQYTVPAYGTSAGRFLIGNYGVGALPVIKGTNAITSWFLDGTLYYAAATSQPKQVFRDGSRLTAVSSEAALASGDWWWDSAKSRVYVYDNPSGHTVEIGARSYCIYNNSKDYTTVSGLDLEQAETAGLNANGNHITITGNTVTNSYKMNINVQTSAAGVISNGDVISNNTVSYARGNGISTQFETNNVEISGNSAFNNCQDTVAYADCAGIFVIAGEGDTDHPNNVTIEKNVSYDNGAPPTSGAGSGIWIDTGGTGIVIRYNRLYGNHGNGVNIDATNGATVFANVIYNNNDRGIWAYADWRTSISGNLIYGNTVYGNALGGIALWGPSSGSTTDGCVSNVVTNNIVVGSTGGPNLIAYHGCENPGTDGRGNTYTYNNFGVEATNFIKWGTGVYKSTYSSWEMATGNCQSTGCSHSAESDPLLEDPAAGRLWLQSGSPAIDAGTNLGTAYEYGLDPSSTWPSGVVLDNQTNHGSGWEIGAYVYGTEVNNVPAPPTSLQAIPR